jgi:Mg2+-importing ATPase
MSVDAGLSGDEAARRLLEYGPNEPVVRQRFSAVVQLAQLFANPLVIILLVASAISAFIGEDSDALIIATLVLLGVATSFWHSYRSGRAVDRLRSSVMPTATVRRDGAWQEIALRDVVPGDVFQLAAGNLVPADARLLASRDLFVQQSMLTGESLPAEKTAVGPGQDSELGPDAPHLVFLGTSVISGTATAVATATGPRTVFGDIAVHLRSRAPNSEFELGLRRFSLLILRTTVVLVLFIVLMGIALKRDAFESVIFAVALGVGLTPEFLPMITSVTLARGALRMARDQVIVKRLPAIQNFGSIDILCCDKTGTLTTGVLVFDRALDPAGTPSQRPLTLAYVNSRLETGIRNPLETAILQQRIDASGYAKVDEIPFDFERRRLSVVTEEPDAGTQRLLITKGAPESILALSTAVEIANEVRPLDSSSRQQCERILEQLGAEGRKVLAVAYRRVERRNTYSRDDECDLVMAGFVSFVDPVVEGVEDVLSGLKEDGVTVKILTGDSELATRHVCATVKVDDGRIVTGEEIAHLDDAALQHVAQDASVFTRMSPAQKNRIILALKRTGHVVGFMGDGINDAPSIHTADVGISVMGATDVARDAADIILGKKDLRVLHQGILEGRRASANMVKYLLMGTSSNFGNVFSMAAASVFLPFLPMLPSQILLNNFLYDLAQVTIPGDNVDASYLQRPHRWDMRVIRNFMVFIGPISSIFDFVTFYVLLHYFHASERLFHTGWFVESLATQTLVLFIIRTMGNPMRSRPSRALTATTIGISALGAVLPATPLAAMMGFSPLPPAYYGFLALATVTYLLLVEVAKRRLVQRLALD